MYVAMGKYTGGIFIEGAGIDRFINSVSEVCVGNKLVIIDVDGTLRDPSQRLHLLPPPFVDGLPATNHMYRKFNEASGMDTPLIENIDRVRKLLRPREDIVSVVLTSCTSSSETRETLRRQLRKWKIPCDAIFMRGGENQAPNPKFKKDFMEYVDKFGVKPHNILAIDDCRDNCQMFHAMGITTLQV